MHHAAYKAEGIKQELYIANQTNQSSMYMYCQIKLIAPVSKFKCLSHVERMKTLQHGIAISVTV